MNTKTSSSRRTNDQDLQLFYDSLNLLGKKNNSTTATLEGTREYSK